MVGILGIVFWSCNPYRYTEAVSRAAVMDLSVSICTASRSQPSYLSEEHSDRTFCHVLPFAKPLDSLLLTSFSDFVDTLFKPRYTFFLTSDTVSSNIYTLGISGLHFYPSSVKVVR